MKSIPLRPRLLHAIALGSLILVANQAIAIEPKAAPQSVMQTDERALARKPLEAYLQGHATGDAAHMRRAFLPTAHVEGMRDGKFVSRTLEEYLAGFNGKPAEDEAQRRRRIDTIDISGNAAMARVTLDYPATVLTDYFVLLKVDGEWKIANKVWTAQKK